MDNSSAMQDQTSTVARISCAVCQQEVPISEAVVPEAKDYLVGFCGLDCYHRWREYLDW